MLSRTDGRRRGVSGRVRPALTLFFSTMIAAVLGASSPAAAQPDPTIDPETGQVPPPFWVPPSGDEPGMVVYPPAVSTKPQPVAVFLHGMCDSPQRECPYFAKTMTREGWLVCPLAKVPCEGGGTMWGWKSKHHTVEASVRRLKNALPEAVDEQAGRTLIGFSLGAIAAVEIAERREGNWKTVVLIGAKVAPNSHKLRKAGVERVLFASGERDMMRWHMTRQAHRLDRRGVPSVFMSMGDVGHWFAPNMDAWMAEALVWLRQSEPGS